MKNNGQGHDQAGMQPQAVPVGMIPLNAKEQALCQELLQQIQQAQRDGDRAKAMLVQICQSIGERAGYPAEEFEILPNAVAIRAVPKGGP